MITSAPSGLRPETRALLREVRPLQPFFPNIMAAELFDAEHTRGPFKLLPRSDGGYAVFDTSAPMNEGVLEHHASVGDAHAALERIALGSQRTSRAA